MAAASAKAAQQLRAQAEEELRTLFTCHETQRRYRPGDELLEKVAATGGPSPIEAGQWLERQTHVQNPALFGPGVPRVKPHQLTLSVVHALLLNSSKTPGFERVQQLCVPAAAAQPDAAAQSQGKATSNEAPLLRLLRRVALWYYSRVMFDPLEQLLAVTRDCELLFQLMTPHQQLSCMADILVVLACPALLQDHSASLDTPQHTATLLSMLSMAQQLVVAEAALDAVHDELLRVSAGNPGPSDQLQRQQQADKMQQLEQQVTRVAHQLTPAAAAALKTARLFSLSQDSTSSLHMRWSGLFTDLDKQWREFLEVVHGAAAAQQEGGWQMLGSQASQAALWQYNTSKVVGALLGQLSQLPQGQLEVWSAAHQSAAGTDSPAAVVGAFLQECCGALRGTEELQLDDSQGSDPVQQLLQWVLTALTGQQQQQQHQQQGQQQQGQQQQPDQVHPAEGLRQVLDVLLSALQYRHALTLHQCHLFVGGPEQQQLLAALHSQCMQLLAHARDQLPPEACMLGQQQQQGHGNVPHACDTQRQQQQQAWQFCVAQVQHELLLMLRLVQQWQQSNPRYTFEATFKKYKRSRGVKGFVPSLVLPLDQQGGTGPDHSTAAAAAAVAAHQSAFGQPLVDALRQGPDMLAQLQKLLPAQIRALQDPSLDPVAWHDAFQALLKETDPLSHAGFAAAAAAAQVAALSNAARQQAHTPSSPAAAHAAAELPPEVASPLQRGFLKTSPRTQQQQQHQQQPQQQQQQQQQQQRQQRQQQHGEAAAAASAASGSQAGPEISGAHQQAVNDAVRLLKGEAGQRLYVQICRVLDACEQAHQSNTPNEGLTSLAVRAGFRSVGQMHDQLLDTLRGVQQLPMLVGMRDLQAPLQSGGRCLLALLRQLGAPPDLAVLLARACVAVQQQQRALSAAAPAAASSSWSPAQGPEDLAENAGQGGGDWEEAAAEPQSPEVLRIRGGRGGSSIASSAAGESSEGEEEEIVFEGAQARRQQQQQQQRLSPRLNPLEAAPAAAAAAAPSGRLEVVAGSSSGSSDGAESDSDGDGPFEEAHEHFPAESASVSSWLQGLQQYPQFFSLLQMTAPAAAAAAGSTVGGEGQVAARTEYAGAGTGSEELPGVSRELQQYVNQWLDIWDKLLPPKLPAAAGAAAIELQRLQRSILLERLQQQEQQQLAAGGQDGGRRWSPEELQHFKVSPDFFHRKPLTAVAWLELLRLVLPWDAYSNANMDFVWLCLQSVFELDEDPPEEDASDVSSISTTISAKRALADPWFLAVLSVLLTEPDAQQHILTAQERQSVQSGQASLLCALQDAVQMVLRKVQDFPRDLARWGNDLDNNVIEPLTGAEVSLRKTAVANKGLEGVDDVVARWLVLMDRQVDVLGTMAMAPFVNANLADDMFKGDPVQVAKNSSRWTKCFGSLLDWLKILVELEGWLGHVGRHLQTTHKLLRRLQRALPTEPAGDVLCVLQHMVQSTLPQVSQALSTTVRAHKRLHEAFETRIGARCWGVIQRAFALMCEAYRTRNEVPVHNEFHCHLSTLLRSRIIGPCSRYIVAVSPYMPQFQLLSQEWADMVSALQDNTWQEMIILLSKFQPPTAGFGWLVAADEPGPYDQVQDRARGALTVHLAPEFASRRSKQGSAGQQQQQQQLRQVHQSRQQQGGSLAAAETCNSSSDSSSSDGQKPYNWTALCGYTHSERGWSSTYSAADDTTLPLGAADAASEVRLIQQMLQDCRNDAHASGQQWQQQQAEHTALQKELSQARAKCRAALLLPPWGAAWDTWWERVLPEAGYLPEDSAESVYGTNTNDSSSSSSGTDSDTEAVSGTREQRRGRGRPGQLNTAAAPQVMGANTRSPAQQQERQQRRLRRLQHQAVRYDWGCWRPWRVLQAAELGRRQLMLNRASELTKACSTAFAAGKQQQQLQQLPAPVFTPQQLLSTAAELLGQQQPQQQTAGVGAATAGGSVGSGKAVQDFQLSMFVLETQQPLQATATEPFTPLTATKLLQHMQVVRNGAAEGQPAQRMPRAELQEGREYYLDVQQRFEELVSNLASGQCSTRVSCNLTIYQLALLKRDGHSTRQLLWELLTQLKPSACQWYNAGAQHHAQQQQQQRDAGSDAAAAAAAAMPECTHAKLWQCMCHSIASDLLLVPPGLRDFFSSSWAAGAGKLGPGLTAASSGSSSSGGGISSSRAAHMLLVQYARAARRQYTQTYLPSRLLGQLLSLQQAAEDDDLLWELRPGHQNFASAALTANTAAAAAGMAHELAVYAACCPGDPGLGRSCCPAISGGGGSGGGSSLGSGSSSSSSSPGAAGSGACRGVHASCTIMPSIVQLAAQAGGFFGMPGAQRVWLQLLTRQHALLAGVGLSPALQCRLAATAAAMWSLGMPLSAPNSKLAAELVEQANDPEMPALMGPLAVDMPPTLQRLQRLWEASEGRQQRSSQQQQQVQGMQQQGMQQGQPGQQQEQQQQGMQPPLGYNQAEALQGMGHYLHADRLLNVPPELWQQHIAEHIVNSSSSSGGGGGSSSKGQAARARALLLADLACDMCGRPVQAQQEATAGSSTGVYGCSVCKAAQYCSQACADAAKEVHTANCWRLQALAANGLCWSQPAFQWAASSGRSRSFWDLKGFEAPPAAPAASAVAL